MEISKPTSGTFQASICSMDFTTMFLKSFNTRTYEQIKGGGKGDPRACVGTP